MTDEPTDYPVGTIVTLHQLFPGRLYKIRHKTETQKILRESVLLYLGRGQGGNESIWSARPIAGTQRLPDEMVYSLERVSIDTPVCINKLTSSRLP